MTNPAAAADAVTRRLRNYAYPVFDAPDGDPASRCAEEAAWRLEDIAGH